MELFNQRNMKPGKQRKQRARESKEKEPKNQNLRERQGTKKFLHTKNL
jgi:hypothetical protein